MLRDLDERHAPPVDRVDVPAATHVVPTQRRLPILPVAIAALVAGAMIVWLAFGGRDQPVPPAPPVPVVTPSPQAISPPPVAASVDAGKAPSVGLLRLDTQLASKSAERKLTKSDGRAEPAASAAPRPAATTAPPAPPVTVAPVTVPVPAAAPPSPLPVVAVPASKPAAPAAAASAPPVLDKRARTSATGEAAEAEYRKALAAIRRGSLEDAVTSLRDALRLDAYHVPARQALLSMLVEQRQWQDAQAVAEEGLKLDPAQINWAMVEARLQVEQGQTAAAVEVLGRHVQHAQHNAEYLAFHALLLQKQRRSREAVEQYRMALALKPAESRWWFGLGVALDADQRPEEARGAFLKAREVGNLAPELVAPLEARLR
jgi:MSHA biogenesis protein MshN